MSVVGKQLRDDHCSDFETGEENGIIEAIGFDVLHFLWSYL